MSDFFGSLPYLIAAPGSIFLRETNPLRRLHLLVHTWSQAIRFVAICLISDLVRHPQLRTKDVDALLTDLQRPSLGHWARALREITARFQEQSIPFFLESWPQCYQEIQKSMCHKCITTDLEKRDATLPLLDALVGLRNALAHGGAPPDDRLSEELIGHYEPYFGLFLEKMAFLAEVAICRVTHANGNHCVEAAVGPSMPFPDCTEWFPEDSISELPQCFLVLEQSAAQILPVYPVMVGMIEDCEDLDHTESLLAYDGMSRKTVHYLGIHKKVESRHCYPLVMELLYLPEKKRDLLNENRPLAAIVQQSLEVVRANRGIKYFPDLYQPRERFVSLLTTFWDQMPKTNALLLVAESGSGKTSLLCQTTTELMSSEDLSLVPLLITGRDLDSAGEMPLVPSDSLGSLGNYLVALLGWQDICDWPSLLDRLGKEVTSYDSKVRVALLLDAVNEAPNPLHLLQEWDTVVGLTRRMPWLKTVATVREGSYEALLLHFEQQGISWPRQERAYVRQPDAQGKPSIAIRLDRFSDLEARQAYQRYQRRAKKDSSAPYCHTNYSRLPGPIQQLIRHPFLLRLLMQTFAGKEISPYLSAISLLEQYHQQTLTLLQQATATEIAGYCYEKKSPEMPQAAQEAMVKEWEAGKDEYQILICLSPLEQLVDVGVMIRGSEGELRFAHQLYLEFVLSQLFRERSWDREAILEKIGQVVEHPMAHLEEERQAFRILLLHRIQEGETAFFSDLIPLLSDRRYGGFLLPLILQLHLFEPNGFQQFLDTLLESTSAPALEGGYEILKTIGDREAHLKGMRRYLEVEAEPLRRKKAEVAMVHLLVMSNRLREAKEMVERLKERATAEGDDELLLSTYGEEGYISVVLAESSKSLAAYRDALAILESRAEGMKEEEYLQKKWELLTGKGCAEHNVDDNEGCRESHLEGLRIAEKLDYAPGAALSLVNLADAHWGCHEYGTALQVFDQAVETSTIACFQDALDVALIGQGIVLWSVGRFAEAEETIQSGLEVARHLDYWWDIAYGLIYLSNVQASLHRLEMAIRTNEEALAVAQKAEAQYLVPLAATYLAWKLEVKEPGAAENASRIDETLESTIQRELKGAQVFIEGTRLLHRISRSEVADEEIQIEVEAACERKREVPLVKGPWEILGLQIVDRLKKQRPGIDPIDLEDLIEETIEEKACSLPLELRSTFESSRRIW